MYTFGIGAAPAFRPAAGATRGAARRGAAGLAADRRSASPRRLRGRARVRGRRRAGPVRQSTCRHGAVRVQSSSACRTSAGTSRCGIASIAGRYTRRSRPAFARCDSSALTTSRVTAPPFSCTTLIAFLHVVASRAAAARSGAEGPTAARAGQGRDPGSFGEAVVDRQVRVITDLLLGVALDLQRVRREPRRRVGACATLARPWGCYRRRQITPLNMACMGWRVGVPDGRDFERPRPSGTPASEPPVIGCGPL